MEFNVKKEYSQFAGITSIILIIVSWVLSEMMTTGVVLPYIVLGLGIIGLIVFLILNYSSILKIAGKRGVKRGVTSILTIIISAGILVTLYVIVRDHLKWRPDLTEEQLYTLSSRSTQLLSNLKSPIQITVFREKSKVDTIITDLLNSYQQTSHNVNVKYLDDPVKHRGLFKKYKIPLSTEGLGAIVIEKVSNKKYITILRSDLYLRSFDRRMNAFVEQYKEEGESKFTSAIATLEANKKLIIYATEGHGEKDFENVEGNGYSRLRKLLTLENYNLKQLYLPKVNEIPDDCTILIIAGPTEPFNSKEIEKVIQYLKNGGKSLILLDPVIQKAKPKLQKLLAKWKIKIDDSFILDSKEAIQTGGGLPFNLGQYGDHKIVHRLKEKKLPIRFLITRPLFYDSSSLPSGLSISTLLTTTNKGWAERGQNNQFNEGVDVKGPPTPINFGVAITQKTVGKGNNDQNKPKENSETRLVILGDSDFLVNQFAYTNPYAQDLFINSINWLTQKKLTIPPKERKIRRIILSEKQYNIISVFSKYLLPFSIVGLGFFVLSKRRKNE